MKPIGIEPKAVCWHCASPVNYSSVHTARYIHRGDQPLTAVVEDWFRCTCGAYQNLRRVSEITVTSENPGKT